MKINWAAALAFVFLWGYGFFGALTSGGWFKNIVIFPLLFLIFFGFLLLWQKRHHLFADKLIIRKKDLIVFLIFFLVLFPLSIRNLTASLVNDGLAHAQQAETHGISLIYLLAQRTGFLNNINFAALLWIVNLTIIVIVGLFYFLFRKKSLFVKIAAFSAAFILFRLLIIQFGGSGGLHPPFRLFPLWLSSVVFSPVDFSFRFAQFTGLLMLGWLIQRLSEYKIGFINSLFLGLASATIPVLWHAGVLVEQSIWTTLAWGGVLLYMFAKPEFNSKDYLRLLAFVSILTLMRQPAFLAFLPVFVRLVWDLRQKKINFKDLPVLLFPILAAVPFLLNNFIFGTAATHNSGLSRVWLAVKSGVIITAITNSVQPVWLIFGLLAFVLALKKPLCFLKLIVLLTGGVLIFYLILPALWGVGRYQAEYIVPFAILGLFSGVWFLKERTNLNRYVLPLMLVVLIVGNIYIFKNIPRLNVSVDVLVQNFNEQIKKPGQYSILSEFPYDYNEALAVARAASYAKLVYIAGSTYGIFPQILNGFSVAEVMAAKNMMAGESILRNSVATLSPEQINSNKAIKLVLISDIENKEDFVRQLKDFDWRNWKIFKNLEYGSTIIGLVRK